MLWHVHKGNQAEALLNNSTINTLRKELTPTVVCKKRGLVKAGEGQFMKVARFVEVTDLLSLGRRIGHVTIVGKQALADKPPVAPTLDVG